VDLEHYVHLNTEAIRKIVKKFKKKVLVGGRPPRLDDEGASGDIELPVDSTALERLILRARDTSYFSKGASGMRRRLVGIEEDWEDTSARSRLDDQKDTEWMQLSFEEPRGPIRESLQPSFSITTFFKFGVSLALLILIIFQLSTDLGLNGKYDTLGVIEAYSVYRSVGLLCLLGLFWALIRFIWDRSGVDEKGIIESRWPWAETPAESIEWWFNKFIIFALMFMLYLSSSKWSVGNNVHIFPLILFVLFGIVALSPFRRFRNTLYLLRIVSISPFSRPCFTTVLVADVLTSLSTILADLVFASCYYGSSLVQLEFPSSRNNVCWRSRRGIRVTVMLIHLWFRMAQCFRSFYDTNEIKNLLNAGKYASSVLAIALGASLDTKDSSHVAIWITAAIFNTTFVTYWDSIMDWGLCSCHHGMLRHKLKYPKWVTLIRAIKMNVGYQFTD